jgi:GPH family glycoside/pentoside/hexuronide:cation symporter
MEQKDVSVKRFPKRIIASFQLGNLVGLMMSQMYSQQLEYYYSSVVNLNYTMLVIAIFIYTAFNMFNDPLLGYLCDRSTRFTRKWGKRFPFIMMGAIPYAFMVIFLFSAPTASQAGDLAVFFWLLIFYCLTDMVFSLYDINRVALFPDKFRHIDDRRIGGTITAILETIGILLGVIIPALIIEDRTDTSQWTLTVIIVAIFSFIIFLMMIPGVREDQDMRDRRSEIDKTRKIDPFFKGMKIALKDRNFLAFTVLYTAYTTAMGIVMLSIPHFVEDILLMGKSSELVLVFYIIFVIVAAPIWYKLSYKIGVKKVATIGALILASGGIPLAFVPRGPEGLGLTILIMIAAGFVDGAIISMNMPIFSAMIDKATIKSGKRREGLYMGTFTFISRVGIFIRFFCAWLIVITTGYSAGTTDPLALLGLRLQISVFPLVIMTLGALVFWKLYNITPEEVTANIEKLKELKL